MTLKKGLQLFTIFILLTAIAGLMIFDKIRYTEVYESSSEGGIRKETITQMQEINLTGGDIKLDGSRYSYNDHLSNYLFMGIDKRSLENVEMGSAMAGQSDAIYLLSVNRMTGESTMVSIPRDTMTYITVYAADTQKEYVLYDHLSLQFGYGDGKHKSCQLTKNAVSALLYNIPIQGYFAMPLDALGSLVKNVEGVEVETPNASLEFETDSFHPGSVVTLDEDNIEEFLRTRDTDEDNSALLRMERQKVFLRAFIDKVRDNYKENPGTLTGLYEDMKPYVVTNIGNDQLADLMDSLSGQVGVKEWTLPGEGVATGEYDEFRVDQDALVGRLVETFCVKS